MRSRFLVLLCLLVASLATAATKYDRLNDTVLIGGGNATTKKASFDIGSGAANPVVQSTSGGSLQLSTDGVNFMTVPAAADTIVGKATTDTLTNKTLTTPVIGSAGATFNGSSSGTTVFKAAATASGTITMPAATDTMCVLAATQTLTGKTISGNTATNLVNGSGTFNVNSSGTVTAPNNTTTLAGLAVAETFTAVQTYSAAPVMSAGASIRGDRGTSGANSFLDLTTAQSSGTPDPRVILRSSQGTVASPTATSTGGTADSLGMFAFLGYDGSSYDTGAYITAVSTESAAWTNAHNGTKIQFATTPTGTITSAVAMTLNADGSATIGASAGTGTTLVQGSPTSASLSPLTVKSLSAVGGTEEAVPATWFMKNTNDNSTSQTYLRFQYNLTGGGTNAGSITGNASTGIAITNPSDRRIKKDIAPLTGSLAKLLALRPSVYRMKIDPEGTALHQGFIAQEFAEVFPEAVAQRDSGEGETVDADHTWTMSQDGLIVHLVESMQEVAGRLEAVEADFAVYRDAHP